MACSSGQAHPSERNVASCAAVKVRPSAGVWDETCEKAASVPARSPAAGSPAAVKAPTASTPAAAMVPPAVNASARAATREVPP
ncbi:hypothetical protein OUO20_10305 [Arthrobacter sp. FX8]|uniref:hypothetical protein n=1 Tax=Arthrobacter sp. FX8 TaxID=2997335 RepID=UPI00227D03B8|nr:hypothetical protein [Arthrobacter sp. FX8]WAJ35168.1 hypothetical protein OUO20_10305 [Arthrobacter sp. FX8]